MKSVTTSLLLAAATLAPQHALATEHTLYVDINGQNTFAPYVTHGNANVTGVGTFIFNDSTNQMDFDIQLNGNEYAATQAHFYNINPSSSKHKTNGESIFCWGGRWSSHSSFLTGTGFGVSSSNIASVVANPEDWMLIIHTEGGHFANDGGGLIEYNVVAHETNDIGVNELNASNWFNNRVGMTLNDLTLRHDNPHYSADNTFLEGQFGAGYFDREADAPYMDALGNQWLESDGNGGWQLTAEAVDAGYDMDTEYLFYRYADDGHDWDYGASEGAAGGLLQTTPIPEPGSLALLAVGGLALLRRRRR